MALSCRSRRWLEHPDSGWLSAGRAHCQHQPIHFRDKEGSTCAGNRRNACNAAIGAIRRVKDVNESLAAADVNAMSLCIDEQVISIATDVWTRDQAAVIHRERAEFGRIPESHENALRGLVERHREIAAGRLHRPSGGLPSGLPVDHGNGLRFWHVDKDPATAWIELETFRVDTQTNVSDLPGARGVDHRQATAAVSDDDSIGGNIKPNVVRVVSEIDLPRRRVVRPSKQPD